MKPAVLGAITFFALLTSLPLAAEIRYVEDPPSPDPLSYESEVNFFYSVLCPICHAQIEYLESLESQYPQLVFNLFEVKKTKHESNRQLLQRFADRHHSSAYGVPRTFIGAQIFFGFEDSDGDLDFSPIYQANTGYRNQILLAVQQLAANSGGKPRRSLSLQSVRQATVPFWVFLLVPAYAATYFFLRRRLPRASQARRYWISGLAAVLVGSIFVVLLLLPETLIASSVKHWPFPVLVGVVALADGFNPCAFTVLFILLSLLTYTKSKRQMYALGNTFILASGIVYFAFIMLLIAVGSVFLERFGAIVLKVLGILVLAGGLINLKDFVFPRKAISLSLSELQKTRIAGRARQIVQSLAARRSPLGLLLAMGGTILLAFSVNVAELGCTAILPTVYMSFLLSRFGLKVGTPHYFWTAVYSVIYILPLLAILLNFLLTFSSERITEGQARALKLVGGAFMLVCGAILLIRPQLLTPT